MELAKSALGSLEWGRCIVILWAESGNNSVDYPPIYPTPFLKKLTLITVFILLRHQVEKAGVPFSIKQSASLITFERQVIRAKPAKETF